MLKVSGLLLYWLLTSMMLNRSVGAMPVPKVTEKTELEQAMIRCRSEQSALIRLSCYDDLLSKTEVTTQWPVVTERADTVKKAIQLEKQRQQDSNVFLISESEGALSPEVIISIPASGVRPPKPLLIFSCQDNITRMQIAFYKQLTAGSSTIVLKTDHGAAFKSYWFIRDNGLLLESSRGLAGIEEIKRLFEAETLSISTEDKTIGALSFPISGLAKALMPLRQACRW